MQKEHSNKGTLVSMRTLWYSLRSGVKLLDTSLLFYDLVASGLFLACRIVVFFRHKCNCFQLCRFLPELAQYKRSAAFNSTQIQCSHRKFRG